MENQQQKPQKPKKKPRLTKKQRGFVRDYVLEGSGTEAALKHYDTKPENAKTIARDLLKKPEIQEAVAIAEVEFKDLLNTYLPERDVLTAHKKLLNSHRLDHMVFPPETRAKADPEEFNEEDFTEEDEEERTKEPEPDGVNLSDADITEMLEELGCKVRRIAHGQFARHVYFWSPDNTARDKALDKAYKLRGRYQDEATPPKLHQNNTFNFLFNDEVKKDVANLEEKIKKQLFDNAQKT